MKKLNVLRAIIFCVFCTSLATVELKTPLAERLHQHVLALTSGEQARNHQNIDSLNSARDYIVAEFKKHGLKVELQEYIVGGKTYANIIARLLVGAEKTVIIGAHYDVCDEHPGADDNASAVAGLLEISGLLQEQKNKLTYNIEFVAYTLEEPPFFRSKQMGSYVHAQSIKAHMDKYAYMMCLEMIGYYTDKKYSQSYPVAAMKLLYPNTGDFIAVVGNMQSAAIVATVHKTMLQHGDIKCEQLVAPAELPGVDFSDHLNYWELGMSAIMITDTAFYRNKNYHTDGDTPDTLNYNKMAEVVKGLLPNFHNL